MMLLTLSLFDSTIKSFSCRSVMKPRQKLGFDVHLKKFELPHDKQWNLESSFGRSSDTIIEIGFGKGESLLQQAKKNPSLNFVGIEVFRPGMGSFCSDLADLDISNVRVVCQDARVVFEECVSGQCVSGVQIFFPDPWPKKRHHKRRLVQQPFVACVCQSLVKGGFIHFATDCGEYAEAVREVFNQEPLLVNSIKREDEKKNSENKKDENFLSKGNDENIEEIVVDDGIKRNPDFLPRPERPLTHYEQRGLNLNNSIWELKYIRK